MIQTFIIKQPQIERSVSWLLAKNLSNYFIYLNKKWAGPQTPTTKNIERQMVTVGDPISQKYSTSGFTWDIDKNAEWRPLQRDLTLVFLYIVYSNHKILCTKSGTVLKVNYFMAKCPLEQPKAFLLIILKTLVLKRLDFIWLLNELWNNPVFIGFLLGVSLSQKIINRKNRTILTWLSIKK